VIALLDTSHDLRSAAIELGCECEQLLTPLTRFRRQDPEGWFAVDNGAFSAFDRAAFLSLLDREHLHIERCRFVAVPDVVGSALRTLEVFERWLPALSGWPLALVAQDGQENLPIPWDALSAIFIGGTTAWKMSDPAMQIIRTAQALGKWSHVGRVNTPGRFEHFAACGVSSIDGTGLSRYSWMRQAIWEKQNRPRLAFGGDDPGYDREDCSQFEAELQECRRPSVGVGAIPAHLIL